MALAQPPQHLPWAWLALYFTALQAELNTNLHEQVILLREQKELSEARAEKTGAEVKKLTAKVRAPRASTMLVEG